MAKKKDNSKWIIVLAIFAIILIAQPGGPEKTKDNITNVVNTVQEKVKNFGGGGGGAASINPNLGNPEKDFMSIRLYDAEGNIIKVPQTFSIVNDIPGVASLDYTVMINNSGARDLSCTLTSVTPQTPFDCATGCSVSGGASISKTTIAIKNGTKQAWTSNRIPTSSMETLSQPITLIAEVSCVYYENGVASTAIIRTGQISFRVLATSGTANFTVTVNTAGVPTEYCGDLGLPGGGCQSPMENTLNCIRDCVIVPNTAFRTDDLTYTSGSAIAWNGGTCGSALTAYGYTGMSCSTLTDATCPTIPGLVQKITSGIKGVPSWSTTTGCLYQNQSASNKMVVAFKQASTPGPCVSNGQWGLVLYDSADPDAAGVSTQIASWDSAKETTC